MKKRITLFLPLLGFVVLAIFLMRLVFRSQGNAECIAEQTLSRFFFTLTA